MTIVMFAMSIIIYKIFRNECQMFEFGNEGQGQVVESWTLRCKQKKIKNTWTSLGFRTI